MRVWGLVFPDSRQGTNVAKDKKKQKTGKKDKKGKKGAATLAKIPKPARAAAKKIKDWSDNPMVAQVVAAALVATASALRDPKKAQQLAAEAGDELQKLSKKGAEQGSALWQMALEIGRRSLEELAESGSSRGKARRK
jgi:hypothetical protein